MQLAQTSFSIEDIGSTLVEDWGVTWQEQLPTAFEILFFISLCGLVLLAIRGMFFPARTRRWQLALSIVFLTYAFVSLLLSNAHLFAWDNPTPTPANVLALLLGLASFYLAVRVIARTWFTRVYFIILVLMAVLAILDNIALTTWAKTYAY